MTGWEWHDKPEMVALFVYLLLAVNYEDSEWRKRSVLRGQLLTTVADIATATGLSPRQIRTCLQRLQKTGEITVEPTNKYTVITVLNYDRYQCTDETERQTHRQTKNGQIDKQKTVEATNKIIDVTGCLFDDYVDVENAERQTKNGQIDKQKTVEATSTSTNNNILKKEEIKKDINKLISKKSKTAESNAIELVKRRERFIESLRPYLDEYGRDMLNEFYEYWTEPNISKSKMKFEQQPTWDLNLRLKRWARNNNNKSKSKLASNERREKKNRYDQDFQQHIADILGA